MELRFVPNDSACTMAAACRLLAGETLPDADLAAALAPGVHELAELLAIKQVNPARVAAHLVAQAASIGSNVELAQVLKRKLGIRHADAVFDASLVRAITTLEAAALRTRPELAGQLAEQAQQLERCWKASGGPHLLAMIARLTDQRMIAPAATVLLGCRGLGPASQALLHYNAVLFCPRAEDEGPLEAAHLAYLLAQLQLDLPIYADRLTRTGPEPVAALAMVPAVLAALGEFVPPARPLVNTAQTASDARLAALAAEVNEATIRLWLDQCGREADSERFAGPLAGWWAAYTEDGNWPLALAALDRLIAQESAEATMALL